VTKSNSKEDDITDTIVVCHSVHYYYSRYM